MSLSLLPTAFLVPPTNLLLAAIGSLVAGRRFPKAARLVLKLAMAGLLLASLPYCAGWMLASLETGLPLVPTDGHPPQAIVILSGDVAETTTGLDVGALTLERERAGAVLARQTGLPILVTGGVLDGGPQSLGALMATSLAQDFTTPAKWVEAQSQDTRENARFSADILRNAGITSVFVVTHAWHMRRSLRAFSGTGIAVTAAPVRLDPPPRLRWREFVPTAHAWLISYYALHEWIGNLGAVTGVR